jgi:rubrerythrin
MTELEKVDRDIATMEESRRLGLQKLGMPDLLEEDRAMEQANIKIYQQALVGLQERRSQALRAALEASA